VCGGKRIQTHEHSCKAGKDEFRLLSSVNNESNSVRWFSVMSSILNPTKTVTEMACIDMSQSKIAHSIKEGSTSETHKTYLK